MSKPKRSQDDVLADSGLGTTRDAIARVLALYDAADDRTRALGLSWYGDALTHAGAIATITGGSVESGACIIAALSPRTPWARNVALAYVVASGGIPATLGRAARLAKACRDSADPLSLLTGPKVSAFARSILGDRDAVTVDIWALRAAYGADTAGLEASVKRAGVYAATATVYTTAAIERGVAPRDLQAIAWCQIRGSAS